MIPPGYRSVHLRRCGGCMTVLAIRAGQMPSRRPVTRAGRPRHERTRAGCPRHEAAQQRSCTPLWRCGSPQGCGRHMVADSPGFCPGGSGKRSLGSQSRRIAIGNPLRSLPMVPRIRQNHRQAGACRCHPESNCGGSSPYPAADCVFGGIAKASGRACPREGGGWGPSMRGSHRQGQSPWRCHPNRQSLRSRTTKQSPSAGWEVASFRS